MTSGAQAQVQLRGPQDVYLLASDETSFWKTEYPRHTNFAIAEMEQNFGTQAGYGMQKNVASLGRNGDEITYFTGFRMLGWSLNFNDP